MSKVEVILTRFILVFLQTVAKPREVMANWRVPSNYIIRHSFFFLVVFVLLVISICRGIIFQYGEPKRTDPK